LDVELLKVGHHGSATASSEDFLRATSPDFAIISVGANNRYGHPSERVLRKLQRVRAEVLRTDLNGDITITLTSTTVRLEK